MENNGGRSNQRLQRVPIYVIVLSVASLMVILFAFIMESRANQEEEYATAGTQHLTATDIQAEIDELEWIEQVLLDMNPFSRPGTAIEEINGIVIHNIGNPGTTAMQNRNFFNNLAITQERRASSQFIICLDGSILQCVPVDEVAYASNRRNNDTLSIEICHPDDTGRFTEESYAAAVRLTAWLCTRFGLTSDDVIRHSDIIATECPKYFTENEDAWGSFKTAVDRAIG